MTVEEALRQYVAARNADTGVHSLHLAEAVLAEALGKASHRNTTLA